MTVDMADGPAVSLSFANNFWGKDDAGVGPLLERMHNAKLTCDELRSFYSARASLEDEYARKLLSLSRKSLGSQETGTLKHSLDVVRGEIESMGKQHQHIAAQMKSELEEPLAAFAGGMKERRKIVQNTVEKLLKTKIQQTQVVNKTRDRYEQECLKIKGYLAQGHMVMGQEERKNKAKLEKTQISLASSNAEYEAAVKALEETTNRWNKEWKQAADKFQDLEEERLDFTKSSLWQFANIASTVCVSDDGSCEKIRLSLEKMEVSKDIMTFISEKGTGQEIPDAPKYINFCRGDLDAQSEVSEDDNYSVAQFSRPINPAFRSSSPQPSTFESHHDPDSALAKKMRHGNPDAATPTSLRGRDKIPTIPQQQQIQAPPQQQQQQQQQNTQTRRGPPRGYQPPQASNLDYDPNEFGPVPHDPYPMDGMTMLCRPTGSDLSAGSQTSARPSSRESNSETSFSSQEQQQQQQQMSPVKQEIVPAQQPQTSPKSRDPSPDKKVLKKKSGFFQNHSPFRRKSTKEVAQQQQQPPSNRNTWHQSSASAGSRPQLAAAFSSNNNSSSQLAAADRTASPDPIAANASLALNVGGNVFAVDDSTRASKDPGPAEPEDDPIAMALAELKGVTQQVSASKTAPPGSSGRISADHYSGLATPAPGNFRSGSALTAAMRGTPPPSYDQQVQVQRLGVPPPAVTSKAMKESSQKFQQQTRSLFSSTDRPGSGSGRPPTRGGSDVPRAASPAPARSASPGGGRPASRGANTYRSTSPNPYGSTSHRGSTSSHHSYSNSQQSMTPKREGTTNYRSSERNSPSIGGTENRSASPNPYGNRPGSSMSCNSMALSIVGAGSSSANGGDEASLYGESQRGRHNRYTRDGRGIMHFARALYMYQAAIPEELGFAKGDVLAILRHQDDGWWEATVQGGNGQVGLNKQISHSSSTTNTSTSSSSSSSDPPPDDLTLLLNQLTQLRTGISSLITSFRSTIYTILTSRAVQKTVISTTLLLISSIILYGISVVAYLAFYYAYLPSLVYESPIHLQYGYGLHPFGILENLDIRDRQIYDVSVEITLPRSKENEKRGNWMVVMHMISSPNTISGQSSSMQEYTMMRMDGGMMSTIFDLEGYMRDREVMYTSARPAILPYEDALVSTAERVLFLPWHILFPKQAEAVTLRVGMAEQVMFGKGKRKLPRGMVVEVQAGQELQVYGAKVVLTAQLGGLRWVMYRWKVSSFLVITGVFWGIEMGFMCLSLLVVGGWLSAQGEKGEEEGGKEKGKKQVKVKEEDEEDEMSDTERTFPTGRGQPPLKYESGLGRDGSVKEEIEEDETLYKVPDFGLEGDDEEDGEGSGWRDSGIGTSYSDAVRREGVVKRRNTGSKKSGSG
ncbi:hypothetical protein QBC38DRAFT_508228 [Podospora fimiseda]|uniref:Cell division control protein n=1 Tax=Podospora fimiseda TaxID=252190 RepID=A0AAN7H2Z1_9PEZI|nr:hypothetical protein QBC38DRAFT_508228 [Podospora fimiseda]